MKYDFRVKVSMAAVAAFLVLFAAVRALLLWQNGGFFAPLPSKEIWAGFWYGLRFDLSVIALFSGPVIFLLNLPVRARWWVKTWLCVLAAQGLAYAGFLIGDLIYFPKVNRHMAEEIVQLSNDWGFIASYAVTEEWPVLLLLLAAFGLTVWGVFRYTNAHFAPRRWKWYREAGLSFLIAVCCVFGVRGRFTGRALGVADVYEFVSSSAGAALTLNGVFTSYQVGRKGAVEVENPVAFDAALQTAAPLVLAQDETVPDAKFPLMRRRAEAPQTPHFNVMIVLLEGWHSHYIDAISHHGYGLTPEFDKVVEGGVVFSNAYAVGQRSIFGFAAVLAGVPPVPGLPLFGYGLELMPLSPLPKHFSDAGYYTFFAQTSARNSFRMCALASALGMKESYGWEDIPQLLDYREQAVFGYDYDALQFAADKIKNRKEPHFFGMVFTGITHEPFTSTLPQFDKYPYDSLEHGFLNTLGFADWSIGEFLKRAKEDGWFDDTVFIFVSDHSSRSRREVDNSLQNQFHIPLVVYAPGMLKPERRDYVVSQADIAPTVYRLTGLNPAYAAFGRDMFDASAPRWALVSEGANIGLVTDKGAVRYGGGKLLDSEAYAPDFDAEASLQTLLSLDKSIYTLLRENRWYGSSADGEAVK